MLHRSMGFLALGLAVAATSFGQRYAAAADVPSPPREFRAAWIATVANIDWPTKPGLSTRQQKRELVALFDKAVDLNLNAVILHVRPAADAFYASKLEPWSEYLTGTMGQAPEPFYDPLEFAVDEAHARGLQLHAWFNPYRVGHSDRKSDPAPNHASVAAPEIVRTYGKHLWFDPGEPESVDRFVAVLTDVVRRYDVDGVHIDDYFYPYQITDERGKLVPFPDDESYARAREAGETLDRDDWRRKNVDELVRRMYESVKEVKPHVLVGISPFGIWRPQHPPGIEGLDQYGTLYSDARKWLREGWVDYFTPQLYWRIEGPQSYPKLLQWWSDENVKGRHLWPGNGAHNVRRSADVEPGARAWPAEELIRQIELTREIVDQPGNVHFSMKCLIDGRDGLDEKLKNGVYAEQALIPEINWLGGKAPGAPEAEVGRDSQGLLVSLKAGKGEKPWQFVVRVRTGGKWKTTIIPAADAENLELGDAKHAVVSAVSRLGLEGPQTVIGVK